MVVLKFTRPKGRPIVFIAHSLGGLVVKRVSLLVYTPCAQEAGRMN